MEKKPRVMYLDVDDTLLIWNFRYRGIAAPKAKEFILWANEHFEIRWLTAWTLSGTLSEYRVKELSEAFNDPNLSELFSSIKNPNGWNCSMKTTGIDFDDPRPWVWVEDDIRKEEIDILKSKNCYNKYYKCCVTRNVVELQAAWRKIADDFNIPGGPELPYSKKVNEPIISPHGTMQDNINQIIKEVFKNGSNT